MEECLKRLSELILLEMGRKNQSCVCFAELCGISRNELGYIINRKKKDLRLSTIFQIVENSNIKIEHIFCDCSTEKILNNSVMLVNGKHYKVKLEEYKQRWK